MFVAGHVDVEGGSAINKLVEKEYMIDSELDFESFPYVFPGAMEGHEFPYTKLSISSESKNFTEDLWIVNEKPISISIKSAILNNGLLVILLLPFLASMISGAIAYKGLSPRLFSFGFLGLLSFLSIPVAVLLMHRFRMDSIAVRKPERIEAEEPRRTPIRLYLLSPFPFTFFIVLICIAMGFAFMWPPVVRKVVA